MTIAYPIKLRFIQNSMRHTVYTVDTLNGEKDLRGNVKAFVAEDAEAALKGLIDACKEKWPNTDFSTLFIRAQKIHTSCLTYDLHDDSDWTNFIVVEKKT